jgi:acyl-CoA oxidase
LALTIAVRYAAVRRQFGRNESELERQLLDYPSHQYRLIPHIAATFAMHFTAEKIKRLYEDLVTAIDSSSSEEDMAEMMEILKEMHATSAGLKAFCT